VQRAPRVTVLIPVFNRERFVSEAIESVLGQDFADFELLIVDDGSTDRTPEVLREWAARDPRVVIVTSEGNEGIPGALNRGLANARGEYIARLDSDDLMMPHRLAEQVAVLDSRPDVVLVSSAYEIIDESGQHLGMHRGGEPHEVVVYLLGFHNIVGGHSQVMYRRDDVLAAGGYSRAFPASEDYDLWERLLRRGRIHTLPLVGMKKRQHENDSLKQWGSIKRTNWTQIMRRALERSLGRTATDDEIAALITIWRHDGTRGRGAIADRVMREAYARFRREHADRQLRDAFRSRVARQWIDSARRLRWAGHNVEAASFVLRAARWWLPLII
jgi:glycosyltransferase involved in cell wall biosynthesis